MLEAQRFFYFMSDDPEPVHEHNPLWDTALPLTRHQQTNTYGAPSGDTLTYGEYFKAVSKFIDAHLSDFLSKAIFHFVKRTHSPHDISRIHIHLEKHGAFYHPARIVLSLPHGSITLVVNVAVSMVGKNFIQDEYRHLKRLADRSSHPWVPAVFGFDKIRVDKQRFVRMFLGQWFQGFHEFHVSETGDSGVLGIRVWDPENENLFLTRHQTQRVFEQAAMILTAYYHIETFEQIHAWHHAAGDFVVCVHEDEPRVKLITVRGYEPLFKLSGESDPLETMLNTLLIFLLKMSIRLRIDRMDGVGDMVWIDMDVVEAIIHGFFKGLVWQAKTSRIPYALIDAFKAFFLHLPETDIRDIFKGLVHQIDPNNPDLPVIKSNLDLHMEAVLSGIRKMKTTR
ncbi:MAG: hypothetical protein JRE21_04580 [Deltaproteobacteria bacterium]|jgi:hypothetical protein|nr:hypothetical protein [Deltaproteobacteria bacterium]